jgi:hypothetical protein
MLGICLQYKGRLSESLAKISHAIGLFTPARTVHMPTHSEVAKSISEQVTNPNQITTNDRNGLSYVRMAHTSIKCS